MGRVDEGASFRRRVLKANSRKAVRTSIAANLLGSGARNSAIVVVMSALATFLRLLPDVRRHCASGN